jgi:hypothetical protein
MGFLDFGKLPVGAMEGMSYQPNWDAMMGRAQQQEMAFLQASQIREEKLKSAAQMLSSPRTSTSVNNRRQEGYIKGLLDDFGTYKTQHPNFESTLEGQQYLYGLSQKIQNNPHKQADARVMDEYKRFRDAVASGKFNGNTQKMLDEQKRFNDYANQKEGDNVPEYIYKPPMAINMNAVAKKIAGGGYPIKASSYIDKQTGELVKYFSKDQIMKLSYLACADPEVKEMVHQAYLEAPEEDPIKKGTKSVYEYMANALRTQFNDERTATSESRLNFYMKNKDKLSLEMPHAINIAGVEDKSKIRNDRGVGCYILGADYDASKGFGALSGDASHIYVQGKQPAFDYNNIPGLPQKQAESNWIDLSKYPAYIDHVSSVIHHPIHPNDWAVQGNAIYTEAQKKDILSQEKGITEDMFTEHNPSKAFMDAYAGMIPLTGGLWYLRGAAMDADFTPYNRSGVANYNAHYGVKWAGQSSYLQNLANENPDINQPQTEDPWLTNWNEPAEQQ